ncbi:hypothetical protein [Paracidovorax anthurii]|uniref:Uncharacterized protein n=1 Tax=Paracidovorax anthurii TaxID=78229 RepID=A0A328Z4V9_9BURK|nr:hypothetical protein [Paracidovorax anthurii]RAR77286.1 hypothetical protein AX018_103821 [Paracidovorax anthurii]
MPLSSAAPPLNTAPPGWRPFGGLLALLGLVYGLWPAVFRPGVRDGLAYNPWHNFPRLTGGRVNIFLASAFAMGGLPGHGYAQHVIGQVGGPSTYRLFQFAAAERFMMQAHEASHALRWLRWTPCLGIFLRARAFWKGARQRDTALPMASVPMAVQLGAVLSSPSRAGPAACSPSS